MKRALHVLSLMFALLLVAPPATHAQDGISKRKAEKIQEKKAKDEKKAIKKKEKEDRKRHLSIQDKETRKRVKRHTKRADRHGSDPHRDGFFRRLFGRKR